MEILLFTSLSKIAKNIEMKWHDVNHILKQCVEIGFPGINVNFVYLKFVQTFLNLLSVGKNNGIVNVQTPV